MRITAALLALAGLAMIWYAVGPWALVFTVFIPIGFGIMKIVEFFDNDEDTVREHAYFYGDM